MTTATANKWVEVLYLSWDVPKKGTLVPMVQGGEYIPFPLLHVSRTGHVLQTEANCAFQLVPKRSESYRSYTKESYSIVGSAFL